MSLINIENGEKEKEDEALPVEHIMPNVEELKITPQKSYKCDICGYSVKTKANLRVHRVKTHRIIESNDDLSFLYRMKQNVRKVYHCPIDGCKYKSLMKGFPKYSALRQHYVWVHEARRYMCSICLRPFPTAALLEKHRQSCGQFHVCQKCGRRYAELKYLRQHIKRMNHYETEDVSESPSKHPEESNNIPNVIVNVNPDLTKSISAEDQMDVSEVKVNPPPMNQVQTTLQPIILPVIIPVPMSSIPAKNETGFTLDSSGISEAISSALRPVLERISNDISTPTTKLSDNSTIVHNGIIYGGSPSLDGKKLSVGVDSNTFIDLSANVAQNTVGLETDMHTFLQPVGSQTDLFGSFDRQCLHVETQTNATVDKMLMTQVSPHLPQQTTSVVQVAMTPSPNAHLDDKKLTASVASEAFIHIPTSLAQTSVALGTEINPLLQPVGSQTEDLFASDFDRSYLHVETQTTSNQHIDVFTEVSRNLQTPQPTMVTAQTLVTNNVAAEFLTHMQTQTDPIDAWIEAELSDIETQTYDLDRYLVASCGQPKTDI